MNILILLILVEQILAVKIFLNQHQQSSNLTHQDNDYLRIKFQQPLVSQLSQQIQNDISNNQSTQAIPQKFENNEPFEKLTIHMIPHSHQDPGWLKTPQEYYQNSVAPILSSVMQHLKEKENRTFIYAEMYFFEQWWKTQNNQTQQDVQNYIKEGKLEFVNGGWVASDEACPLYFDLLENIKKGHDFLNSTFGVIPKMAWQADAFGHSSQTAKFFKELGFEALFFGRMTDEYKQSMLTTKDMAFIWNPEFEGIDQEYRSQDGIYTHLTRDIYVSPYTHSNTVHLANI
ncbi:glycosyl hydrolases family 38 protein [Stylonychia lemnae]|uniref:Glycosyl hydrolases family 38 protein n=1 Tax=Stylonychia lemnae TaxID=5949 RepID=A0A078AJX6_STYLE|nr:glycosyl hydrolases family 38 protein [Stylonychia lemnae]|eukprot:CDW82474.1 glycosyl hydrolases family 38 protein [Stylonychia lemnae]